MSRHHLSLLLAGAALLALGGCSDDDDDDASPAPAPAPSGNVVQTAQARGYTSLTGAVEAAGLTATLSGTGPFTVFAPTNAAFEAVSGLTATLTPTQLGDVLTYHVLSGRVGSTQAISVANGAGQATTVNGAAAFLDVVGGNLYVNEARVIAPDIDATNGVIHGIDKVILPPDDIYATLSVRGLTTLKGAIDAAGLADALDDDSGTLTLFAPTNAAFAAIDTGMLTPEQLQDVLTYHVVPSTIKASAAIAAAGTSVTTLQGDDIIPSVVEGGLRINGSARVTVFNIRCTNGVIHIIDAVLTPPPSGSASLPEPAREVVLN